MAAKAVISASRKPSGVSSPAVVVTASVYMWIPTFPHEQETASWQGERSAAHVAVTPIWIEPAGDPLEVLREGCLQGALHDPEPIAIDDDLVGGIDCRNGILAVLDGCDGAFQLHVIHARRMRGSHRIVAVDSDLDMKAVVTDQDHS